MASVGDEPYDFGSEMWLAVHEGAFLFEVPHGSRTLTHEGWSVAGPWSPQDCSVALLTWLDHGWLQLTVAPEQLYRWPGEARHLDLVSDRLDSAWHHLETTAARNVLAQPDLWVQSRPEGFLCLDTTRAAPSHEFRELWLAALDAPPE